MFKRSLCRSANGVDVVSVNGPLNDLVSALRCMRKFGVRLFVFTDSTRDLALNFLEVLGELLFGKFFVWLLHRTAPVLVPASLLGRGPWPIAR